jgi:endo-1,4-beta-xylanase
LKKPRQKNERQKDDYSHHAYEVKKMTKSRIQTILACLVLIGTRAFTQPLATGHEKFIGNVINFNIPASFEAYWNQVTPENASKWGSVEGARDQYGWGGADLAYNYARQRGLPFKFHTLIWGNQQPGWITQLNPAEKAEEIEEWIRLIE